MKIDKELVFSDDQTLIAAASAINSTKVIDAIKDGGPYKGLWLYVKTGPDAFVGAASTVSFVLHTSNDGFSSDDDILFSSGALAVTALTANTELIKAQVPLGLKQDIKMVYTIVGAAGITTGAVYAALVPDVNEGF